MGNDRGPAPARLMVVHAGGRSYLGVSAISRHRVAESIGMGHVLELQAVVETTSQEINVQAASPLARADGRQAGAGMRTLHWWNVHHVDMCQAPVPRMVVRADAAYYVDDLDQRSQAAHAQVYGDLVHRAQEPPRVVEVAEPPANTDDAEDPPPPPQAA